MAEREPKVKKADGLIVIPVARIKKRAVKNVRHVEEVPEKKDRNTLHVGRHQELVAKEDAANLGVKNQQEVKNNENKN